jgi:hypothetical protein
MANAAVGYPTSIPALSPLGPSDASGRIQSRNGRHAARLIAILLLAAAVFLAPLLFAQGTPRISSANPTSGKADDTVTVMG